ncbi:serine hydrolase domain-containing protein, partial [Streptomyces sp. CB01881]|uniref:serine hydrolase domain-containing protein n=1 Tax=Streptomyces sp. CB01881 TaxID=2078691 RepID=UPI001883AA4A
TRVVRVRRRRGPALRTAAAVLAGVGLVGALAPVAAAHGAPQSSYGLTVAGGAGGDVTDEAVSGGAGAPTGVADSVADADRGAGRGVDPAALDAAVRGLVSPGGASATLGLVSERGRTVWKGAAGTADLATGARASADGRFRIGSVTKTFVATVLLQLVAEHRLGLDDPVERHLPGLVLNGGQITVRQLLNHTSGLANYTDDPAFSFEEDDGALQQWLSTGRWRSYRPQELIAIAAKYPPYFAPGQGWHYSNTNYIVAGLLVERLTGRTWGDEVEHRIIRPLGLTGTSMPVDSPFIPGPHAHGYYKLATGPADATLLNPSMGGAAGAGISTTADLTRFLSALLGGRLLGPAELAEMKRTTPQSGPAEYGLGLQRTTTACGEFWGHGGGIPGYNTLLYGTADGRRQFAASVNPYDMSDLPATNAAFETLVATGTCGGRPPAAAGPLAPPATAAIPSAVGPAPLLLG